jgi:hypothetical protein
MLQPATVLNLAGCELGCDKLCLSSSKSYSFS